MEFRMKHRMSLKRWQSVQIKNNESKVIVVSFSAKITKMLNNHLSMCIYRKG